MIHKPFPAYIRDFQAHYRSAEYLLGVVCPLLSVLSVLSCLELLRWTFVVMAWLSIGHFALYLNGNYPALHYRPYLKGMFVFGIGMAWPLWLALREPKKDFWR